MTTKFLRKGATIATLDEEGSVQNIKTYTDPMNINIPSINAAKRASRQLQAENGGLGSLKVVAKLPS